MKLICMTSLYILFMCQITSIFATYSAWETVKPVCNSQDGEFYKDSVHEHLGSHKSVPSSLIKSGNDILCTKKPCPVHSFCFLGACPCHPGYIGNNCDVKMDPSAANPWHTENCPNLLLNNTMDIDTPLDQVGGEHTKIKATVKSSKTGHPSDKPLTYTAYLCFSHPSYGTAVVPKSLWHSAQTAEGNLWQEVGKYTLTTDSNDRAVEHWKAFGMFASLTKERIQAAEKMGSGSSSRQLVSGAVKAKKAKSLASTSSTTRMATSTPTPPTGGLNLGRVIEVGAGPWTQFKGLMHVRPDLLVEEFTVWEPGASRYMKEVPSCSYRDGKALSRWEVLPGAAVKDAVYPFPIKIVSTGGELLSSVKVNGTVTPPIEYDTLLSINVLEHVQNAFEYLNGLYLSLRPGGVLIMHERYYDLKTITDGDLYHPIRVKRQVLDRFLSGFTIVFNNCSANYDNRPGEKGYYVIAVKNGAGSSN